MDPITVTFRVPKGKKNNNMIFKGRFITNPKARKDENELSTLVLDAAKKAGWETPINNYVSVSMSFDCLLDTITLVITPLEHEPPTFKWGGKRDIQNIFDTVADSLECNKRHDGVLINDNRIAAIFAERSPLLKRTPKTRRKTI